MLLTGAVNTDIIDVEDSSFSCSKFYDSLPEYLGFSGGGLARYGQNYVPFLCGGTSSGDFVEKCWQLLAR